MLVSVNRCQQEFIIKGLFVSNFGYRYHAFLVLKSQQCLSVLIGVNKSS